MAAGVELLDADEPAPEEPAAEDPEPEPSPPEDFSDAADGLSVDTLSEPLLLPDSRLSVR